MTLIDFRGFPFPASLSLVILASFSRSPSPLRSCDAFREDLHPMWHGDSDEGPQLVAHFLALPRPPLPRTLYLFLRRRVFRRCLRSPLFSPNLSFLRGTELFCRREGRPSPRTFSVCPITFRLGPLSINLSLPLCELSISPLFCRASVETALPFIFLVPLCSLAWELKEVQIVPRPGQRSFLLAPPFRLLIALPPPSSLMI